MNNCNKIIIIIIISKLVQKIVIKFHPIIKYVDMKKMKKN